MMNLSTLPLTFLNAIVPTLVVAVSVHRWVLRKEFPVHQKGAILISGTSSGIGRATCEWLAGQAIPTNYFLCWRLPNVKQVILVDITNQHHADAVIEQIKVDQVPLIALVNNPGLDDISTFEFMGVYTIRKIMEVNVMATYMLTQAALPIIQQNKGRIITVSSAPGLLPGGRLLAAYQGSKHALEAMFDALRVEVAPHDVSMSLIEPGFFLQSNSAEPSTELATTTGSMEATCQNIQDAIFEKYPKPRYLTSRVGALPSWLAARVVNVLPA
ncbi:Dehydrogenase/reductase SDR family member 7B [Seminavis robusta]|uniref:Dehydrogenase/reductase SDR family member 7B n=1 Tax=Seminavis robusta TaxID=568900 RepID=A0A9N8HCI1_9STRA|nr:Dehydrogenase/reductase SDR family member 7B [Seminavis robusta]|eukprot:Sro410_g137460.1 Dehydrogenase/reductase SDR family member 7B (271) ;mRNA; f:54041-54884